MFKIRTDYRMQVAKRIAIEEVVRKDRVVYMIRQLSVFVENRPGSFRQVTELLRQHRIETEAFCSVDSPEFGILRLIVDQPAEAERVLAAQGLLVKNYDVIEVAVEDMESLDALLLACTESNVNINYMYSSFGGEHGQAVIFHCEYLEETESMLRAKGFVCR